MKKIVVTTALLAGILAQAGGFRVALQGVKQLAMAHTSAHAEDASVGFFNPAGISFIPILLKMRLCSFSSFNKLLGISAIFLLSLMVSSLKLDKLLILFGKLSRLVRFKQRTFNFLQFPRL